MANWLAWIWLLLPALALGDTATVEHFPGAPAEALLSEVRASTDGWQAAPEAALRRAAGSAWWRVRVPAASGDEPWVVALREAFDAELTAYAPPDYRPQRLATFDSAAPQIGSRHRLSLEVPPAATDSIVYLRLERPRAQPIRVELQPRRTYLDQDAQRIRMTSALLSAQALLGLVAAIFALALGRRMLLLFSVWVASSVVYLAVMSGEMTSLLPGSALLPHAMRINSIAINLGMVCAYGFVRSFLDLPRHFPRLDRVFCVLLGVCVVVLVGLLLDPTSMLLLNLNNLTTMALGVLALGAGLARALAGSPQGWFYLLGWGSVSAAGLYRASCFLRGLGTPEWLEFAHPAINSFGALVLVLATARAARYAEQQMQVARVEARTDPLTGLPNRGELDRALPTLVAAAQGEARPLSLMFLDLDHFKAVNDRFGHGIGDACLAEFAQIVRAQIRASDLLARYGGEEFVLVLPGASPSHALDLAEALRAAVEQQAQEICGRPVRLTVSVGLATLRPDEPVASLVARADAAVYRAKREGRNRVAQAGAEADSATPLPAAAP